MPLLELTDEMEAKYDARQPRDDLGRWSEGGGGISVGHALHVAKSEGIDEKHHAGIREGIESGRLDTREKVLAHIDAIHEKAAKPDFESRISNLSPSSQNLLRQSAKLPGYDGNAMVDRVEQLAVGGKITDNHVHQAHWEAQGAALQKRGNSLLPQTLETLANIRGVTVEGTPHKDAAIAAGSQSLGEKKRVIKPEGVQFQHDPYKGRNYRVVGPDGGSLLKQDSNGQYQPAHFETESAARNFMDKAQRAHGRLVNSRKSAEEDTMPDETLIAFGEGIKSVEETEDGYKFGAFLVVFDSPDISTYRDSFTKSTDYGFEDGDTRPILYNHGLDGTCGKATIGKARLYMKDAGVWMEGEVKKRRDYLEKHIEKLGEGLRKTINVKGVEAPMFGTSSGSTAHAVVRERRGDGHEIKQWFIGEASITPTPAEPQTACMSLKSLVEMEGGNLEDEDDYLEAKWDESEHPRQKNGEFGSGGAGGSSSGGGSGGGARHLSVSADRMEKIASQYGVTSNSVAMGVLHEAYKKGHIKSAADVHNILSHSAKSGHEMGALHNAINEHGSGGGGFRSALLGPKNGGGGEKKMTARASNAILKEHGLGPNSVATGVIQEAIKGGHIKGEKDLRKVLEKSKAQGFHIGVLHAAINQFGEGPKHNGNFLSALLGGKKSWDDISEEEREVAIKNFMNDTPEYEMDSGTLSDEAKSLDNDLLMAEIKSSMMAFDIDLADFSAVSSGEGR